MRLAQERLHRPEEAILTFQWMTASWVQFRCTWPQWGAAMRRRSSSHYVSPFDIATVYVGLNMHDAAFKALEAAYEGRAYGLVFLRVDPRFDPICSDPRYTDLVRRIGLPAS